MSHFMRMNVSATLLLVRETNHSSRNFVIAWTRRSCIDHSVPTSNTAMNTLFATTVLDPKDATTNTHAPQMRRYELTAASSLLMFPDLSCTRMRRNSIISSLPSGVGGGAGGGAVL